MNWFHSLMIALVLFVGLMVYFAVRSIQTPLDLVTEKYYEAELNYQQRIDEKANAALLEEVKFEYQHQRLMIVFPEGMTGISGSIQLYYAGGKSKDRTIPIESAMGNRQMVDVSDLSGAYHVKVNWESAGKTYYSEKKIFI